MITQKNPVHAAISFTLVVMSTCGLFLLQAAPFLMAATIIIYAGAIVVTFLFVLMLSQQAGFSDADDRTREPFLAAFAGFLLLGSVLLVIHRAYPSTEPLRELVEVANAAQAKASVGEMVAELGDDPELYVAEVETQGLRHRASPASSGLLSAAENLKAAFGTANPNPKDVR